MPIGDGALVAVVGLGASAHPSLGCRSRARGLHAGRDWDDRRAVVARLRRDRGLDAWRLFCISGVVRAGVDPLWRHRDEPTAALSADLPRDLRAVLGVVAH